jgi:sialidase-1
MSGNRAGARTRVIAVRGEPDCQLWLRYSDDNGRTWSESADITRQGRDYDRWGHAVFGPGHGIETSSGRLVIPVNEPGEVDGTYNRSVSFAIYSDDGGATWNRGSHMNAPTNENQIVELDDGRLLIDARQTDGGPTRYSATSNDQGETWENQHRGQVCAPIAASILRYPRTDKGSLLLWSGIKGPGRSNLVLRLSSDQGVSFPIELLIGSGPTAYSDKTLMRQGDIGILWEGGSESPYEKVIFTRIPAEIITKLEVLSTLNSDVH